MATSGPVLRTVHLYGHLAEGIGPSLKLCFDTPAKAVRLLELNFPGFMQRLKEGYYRVVAIRADGRERALGENHLGLGFTGDLAIIPVVAGSDNRSKGLLGAVLGAVLIGAAIFFSGGTLAAALPGIAGGTLGLTYGTIAQLGVGLLLTGVSTMLTPTPETDYSEVDEKRSFVFNGPVNLTQPGGVLPLIYGRMMVGTYTVSAAFDTEYLLAGSVEPLEVLSSIVRIHHNNDPHELDMDDLTTEVELDCRVVSVNGTPITEATSIALTTNLTLDVDPAADTNTMVFTYAHPLGLTPLASPELVEVEFELRRGPDPDFEDPEYDPEEDTELGSGLIRVGIGNVPIEDPSTDPRYTIFGLEAFGNYD